MPISQGLALSAQPVGAGGRQPGKHRNCLRGQAYAIGHKLMTFLIVATPACVGIKQAAGHICRVNFARILIFKLDQAATTAPVAQCFPLLACQVL